MIDIEDDKELRSQITLYKDPSKVDRMQVDESDNDGEGPDVDVNELVDLVDNLQLY